MSRPLRIEFENAFHHVMNRGRGRQDIFLDDTDYQYFLHCIELACQRFKVEIHAYCLMTNHYHLLIKTPNANLSYAMKHINGLYTQYFNRKHHTDGSLFRGRYKSVLVDADNYLLHVSRYIHRNPIETKKPMVEKLSDYFWSSYPAFINEINPPTWLNRDFIYQLQNKHQKYNAYKQYVELGNDQAIGKIYNAKKLLSILGEDSFVKRVKNNIKNGNDEIRLVSKNISPEVIVAYLSKRFSLDQFDILNAKQGVKEKNLPRWCAIKLCQDLCGMRLSELAYLFNVQSYTTISKTVSRLNKLMQEEKEIKSKYDKLLKGLMSEVKI
ncbi:transposase [Marinicellulosiphila megalodicopiae]|uniref:transposase n=1 Tax=Marinicellulosiphila megalodicopiae TaxID=2724896 RepID=UPI003BB026A2